MFLDNRMEMTIRLTVLKCITGHSVLSEIKIPKDKLVNSLSMLSILMLNSVSYTYLQMSFINVSLRDKNYAQ